MFSEVSLHKKAVPHFINSHALIGKKPCINKPIHALLMHAYTTLNMLVPGPQIYCCYEMCTPSPRTSIVHGNYIRQTSVKRSNKIVQNITQNVANIFIVFMQ